MIGKITRVLQCHKYVEKLKCSVGWQRNSLLRDTITNYTSRNYLWRRKGGLSLSKRQFHIYIDSSVYLVLWSPSRNNDLSKHVRSQKTLTLEQYRDSIVSVTKGAYFLFTACLSSYDCCSDCYGKDHRVAQKSLYKTDLCFKMSLVARCFISGNYARLNSDGDNIQTEPDFDCAVVVLLLVDRRGSKLVSSEGRMYTVLKPCP